MRNTIVAFSLLFILPISVVLAGHGISGQAVSGTDGEVITEGHAILFFYDQVDDVTPIPHIIQLDSKGNFEFEGIKAGLYKIAIEPLGEWQKSHKPTYYPTENTASTADFIQYNGAAEHDFKIKVRAGATVNVFASSSSNSAADQPPVGASSGDPIPGMDVSLEQIPGGIPSIPQKFKRKKSEETAIEQVSAKFKTYAVGSRICVEYTDATLGQVAFIFANSEGKQLGTLSSSMTDLIPGSTLTSYPLFPGEYSVRTADQSFDQAIRVKIN